MVSSGLSAQADRPPPAWKRTSSLMAKAQDREEAGEGPAWAWPAGVARTASSGGSPRLSSNICVPAGAALGDGAVAALKLAAMKLSACNAERTCSTTPPLSPIKAAWVQPALSDAAASGSSTATPRGLSPRALEPAGCRGHRRTTSWSSAGTGLPAGVGRPPAGHRRSRSIEAGGGGALAEPGDAFRAELERIGSAAALHRRSSASGEPAGASAVSASAARGPGPERKEEKAAPRPGVEGAGGRQEEAALISWDELDAQRDVYRAVATADGRHALVRSPSGKGAVEVLLVHDGAPAAPERAAPPPAQGPALPGSSHAAPAGMAPAYAVAAPGAPGGAALLAPGSPPPQAPLRVVGYAPLPAGDLAAYLSPRAAPAPPARREWRHAPAPHASRSSCGAERVSSPGAARNHADPFGESAVW